MPGTTDKKDDTAEPTSGAPSAASGAETISAAEPRFVQTDLTELSDGGVLYLANQRFFWPLGLALAWERDVDGTCSNLHVRQWEYADGHREMIADLQNDGVGSQRVLAFVEWMKQRLKLMPANERYQALRILGEVIGKEVASR